MLVLMKSLCVGLMRFMNLCWSIREYFVSHILLNYTQFYCVGRAGGGADVEAGSAHAAMQRVKKV